MNPLALGIMSLQFEKGVLEIQGKRFSVLSVLNLRFSVLSESQLVLKGARFFADGYGKIVYDTQGKVMLQAPLSTAFLLLKRKMRKLKLREKSLRLQNVLLLPHEFKRVYRLETQRVFLLRRGEGTFINPKE